MAVCPFSVDAFFVYIFKNVINPTEIAIEIASCLVLYNLYIDVFRKGHLVYAYNLK